MESELKSELQYSHPRRKAPGVERGKRGYPYRYVKASRRMADRRDKEDKRVIARLYFSGNKKARTFLYELFE